MPDPELFAAGMLHYGRELLGPPPALAPAAPSERPAPSASLKPKRPLPRRTTKVTVRVKFAPAGGKAQTVSRVVKLRARL
jgi:hypothetical protein